MLTAHKIKVLQSLDRRKYRQKYNLFLVEGNKTIRELFGSGFEVREIFTKTPQEFTNCNITVNEIDDQQLRKISFLQNPKDSVAVCMLKENSTEKSGFNLILDGIQDPGNMGTIIRLADWFGISQIICSEDTVDFYNPKVIQSSMGSFTRVNIIYTDLEFFLKESENFAVGTDMDGTSIYNFDFPEKINLVLGNEGNGMRANIEKLLAKKVTIPRFGESRATESLNVSVAAGIILGEIFSKK